jgi:hypothetical protein
MVPQKQLLIVLLVTRSTISLDRNVWKVSVESRTLRYLGNCGVLNMDKLRHVAGLYAEYMLEGICIWPKGVLTKKNPA